MIVDSTSYYVRTYTTVEPGTVGTFERITSYYGTVVQVYTEVPYRTVPSASKQGNFKYVLRIAQ